MSGFQVVFEKRSLKQLKQLDKPQQKLIFSWIEKHLEGTENPRMFGKALRGSQSDFWRYRVGNYRIIAEIVDQELRINLIRVGHRREVYRK